MLFAESSLRENERNAGCGKKDGEMRGGPERVFGRG